MGLTIVGQKHHGTSWSKVAKAIYKYLKMHGIDVKYVDFNYPQPDIDDHVLLVPLEWTVGQDPDLARFVIKKARSIAAFVSTDSLTPGDVAVYLARMIDVVILTGNFAVDLWRPHIPTKYINVVHLGVDDEIFSKPYNDDPIDTIKYIRSLPGKKVLLIWHHDTFRKNMDIVAKALEELISEGRNDFVPIIKVTPFTKFQASVILRENAVLIKSTLSESDMVDLYDSVDLVIVPSGAGSCELVAIEAMARGVPTITTTWYSFIEYVPEAIQVPCSDWEEPPKDVFADMFSKGAVCRIDKDVLKNMIATVLDNIDEWKKLFKTYAKNVLERWSWRRIVREELIPVLESRGFI